MTTIGYEHQNIDLKQILCGDDIALGRSFLRVFNHLGFDEL
jgi:hypothetical protein